MTDTPAEPTLVAVDPHIIEQPIGALEQAADTMNRSAAEIRDILAKDRLVTIDALRPWLHHTVSRSGQPCLVGTRDDDGDHPQPCICGLNEALGKASHPT